ncbi:MAG TPA: DUF6711 family protein [Tissierellaceae bacterium]|nr:DUF6711 family protein [Tissierellaceae bacterium]
MRGWVIMININGVRLPDPSVYNIPLSDLDSESTGRNEKGVLHRDRLRQGIYKIELEWWAIDNSKVQTILSAVQPDNFSVRFIDHVGYKTKTMYAGDKNVEMVRYMSDRNKMAWNVSFNLIEF